MRKLLLIIGVMVGLLVIPLSGFSGAQESDFDEIGYFAYGTVVNISPAKVVVKEYDYDSDGYKDMTYEIDGSTKFENVGSYKEIQTGDEVEINYKESGERMIALLIAKETLDTSNYTYKDEGSLQ